MMNIMTRFACVVLPLFLFTLPLQSQEKAKTQEVVVDGAGTSADLALKDAFRNAVSQVVGALVDAETLVKNDKLVEDNILTYSNGFIKTYTEVEGSKKFQSGIHRVKIKATVVTGSVVEKLKAAKITIKEVDGKGLFSEAMSKLESEKDAGTLIAKHMKNFPHGCMKASVVGVPQIVEKGTDKIKTKFVIKVEPDIQAYKTLTKELSQVLEKAAFEKGEFTIYYEKHHESYLDVPVKNDYIKINGPRMIINNEKKAFPNLNILNKPYSISRTLFEKNKKPNGTIFILGSLRNELGTNCSYKYYFLDSFFEFRENRDKSSIKLTLQDDKEEAIVSENRIAFSLLCCINDRGMGGEIGGNYNFNTFSLDSLFRFDNLDSHFTFYTFEFFIELTPDELKKTKTAKVEISPTN